VIVFKAVSNSERVAISGHDVIKVDIGSYGNTIISLTRGGSSYSAIVEEDFEAVVRAIEDDIEKSNSRLRAHLLDLIEARP
jgi:hypothetical protein